MKLVTVFLLLLATNLALAQTSGGSGGTGTSGAAAPATPAPPTGQPSVQPGATAPSPADNSTVGRAPGVNPSNSQDLTGRSNPQDLTQPRGSNSQDLSPPGPRDIVAPEKR